MSNGTNATNDGHVDPYVAMLTSPSYLLHLFGVGPFILGMLAFLWSRLYVKRIVRKHENSRLYNKLMELTLEHKVPFLSPNCEIARDHSDSDKKTKEKLCEGTTYMYINLVEWWWQMPTILRWGMMPMLWLLNRVMWVSNLAWVSRHDTIRERGPYQSVLTIATFRWNRTLMMQILDEKINEVDPPGIYVPDGNYWNRFADLEERPYIETNTFKEVREDISHFLTQEAQDRYRQDKLPYKRGYMLHSKPGAWKTSFVVHICWLFKLDLFIIEDWSKVRDFESLMHDMHRKGRVGVLYFEDFDGKRSMAGAGDDDDRRGGKNKAHQMQTLIQGMLSGVKALKDVIVIVATNHPDMIEDSLIRPGRIDMKRECTHADCITSAFRHYYPNHADMGQTLVERILPLSYDTGVVAEKLKDVHQSKSPQEAINYLVQWFTDHPADSKSKKVKSPPKKKVETDTIIDDYCWI
jgi:hypothetical protein